MDELEQLNRELDVAQAAAAELELSRRMRTRDIVLDPSAHRTRGLDEALTRRGAPHVGLRGILEGPADDLVSRAGTGLQQRLKLPRLRPFVPVLTIGLNGTYESAVTPLRAQVGINSPQRCLGAGTRARRSRCCRESRGDLEGHTLVLIHPGFSNVDDINVGDVVEFACPRLTHRDDCERGLSPRIDIATGKCETSLERRIHEVRDAPANLGHEGAGILTCQIVGGHRQENASVGCAQVVRARPLCGHIGSPLSPSCAHGSQEHLLAAAGILPDRHSAGGISDDVVPQPLAAAQHGAHAAPGVGLVHESAHEAGVRFVQTDRGQERLVGIGARAQVTLPRLGTARQLLEKAERAARVQESGNPKLVRRHRGTTFRNCSSSWRVIC